MNKILTVNPGSTAVKYTLFDGNGDILDVQEFSRKDADWVHTSELKWLDGLEGVDVIGIRIVHGGSITKPTLIDDTVLAEIKSAKDYAPIHNTIAIDVILTLRKHLQNVQIIAVFDTDFHSTLPAHAYTYPIQATLAHELNIRRYGFHGTALKSVLAQLPEEVTKSNIPMPRKIIMIHLGGGSSITAVENAKSIDTTMGLTPLEGIMMTTRSGSVDPDLLRIIAKKKFLPTQEVSQILNEQSGFYGLTGSKDTKDIIERATKGEEPYKLAVDIFVHQIVKQIFAYYGLLGGADALTFSGGIGFGNKELRNMILEKTELIALTQENTFVVQTNEAQEIFNTIMANR